MTTNALSPFAVFRDWLMQPDLVDRVNAGLIGKGAMVDGPMGPKPLIYADYVASGRAVDVIESIVLHHVLPYYSNSHTEASYCGRFMSGLRAQARAEIARICGADERFATIFCGSGATAGLNRLVNLLGCADRPDGRRTVVLTGPYEHHSNILPWRDSGAKVIEIPESEFGGPDLGALETALSGLDGSRDHVIGTFSAASNVTGIVTDTDAVTRVLKRYGALSVWDYAGGGPYLPIDMRAGTDAQKDAVVLSPHKFVGGPGASGVLLVNRAAVEATSPTWPGGGTVTFVSPWAEDYSRSLETREEAGTPNLIGDIRAGLCVMLKDAIGDDYIAGRNQSLRQQALDLWAANPNIGVLGNPKARDTLPIFSIVVRDKASGVPIHHQLFTRLLSDCFGIQARGGCACAGPYAHRLLGIDQARSEALRTELKAGLETEKPGWTRLNLSYLCDAETVAFILASVDQLARDAGRLADQYEMDPKTARFFRRDAA